MRKRECLLSLFLGVLLCLDDLVDVEADLLPVCHCSQLKSGATRRAVYTHKRREREREREREGERERGREGERERGREGGGGGG